MTASKPDARNAETSAEQTIDVQTVAGEVPEGFDAEAAADVVNGSADALWICFPWFTSAQGHKYWARQVARLESGDVLAPEAAAILNHWIAETEKKDVR